MQVIFYGLFKYDFFTYCDSYGSHREPSLDCDFELVIYPNTNSSLTGTVLVLHREPSLDYDFELVIYPNTNFSLHVTVLVLIENQCRLYFISFEIIEPIWF